MKKVSPPQLEKHQGRYGHFCVIYILFPTSPGGLIGQVHASVELIKSKGGKITKEPGSVEGVDKLIAFAEDPDGYTFALIQNGPTKDPFTLVNLRVGDLDRAIRFYEKV